MSKKTHKRNNDISKTLKSNDIENIYFNEFALGVSKNDVFMLLRRNGREEIILNASHITAKTFAIALNEAISNFEEETNQKIVVSEDIEKKIGASDKE
ncbi:Uncharacterized protein dnl_29840 [Desulfonema limicola]|uniref:DUF3467 domain-containing protein n=1 Tax=Desulfonema limicola TaxID=45656 RepID=A0A975B8A7_9BACT|nr:hypothetical protein [Desulfonema limicola]QTA80673.1 Uncharacterized protein dnl_29840 [Desulfonema limicola]